MDSFLQNAQSLCDTAADAPGTSDRREFALLVREDGGLHFVMDSALTVQSLDSIQQAEGARAAYRVTRSGSAIRVEGRERGRRCLLEQKVASGNFGASAPSANPLDFLRDAPAYRITSPLLGSGASEMGVSTLASRMYLA